MQIPPKFKINLKVIELIVKIDSIRLFFKSNPLPANLKEKIQRISLLKSSLFSARIEGNPLTLEEISTSPDKQKKEEVFNLIKACNFIDKYIRPKQEISNKIILEIHSIVMQKLNPEAGQYRKEMSAIFNQAGVAIYLPPSPLRINKLLKDLLVYINFYDEKFPLIKAAISHLIFEKIHPFIDGNGRVGRLLIYTILKSQSYDFGLFVPFEEYLDNHKTDYYHYLDNGFKNTTGYLIFMLTAYLLQIEKLKAQIEKEGGGESMLPPRQEEILNIINDHKIISFDFLHRRFLKIPKRTLRYDLKKLVDQNLVLKVGKTRGSFYRSKII